MQPSVDEQVYGAAKKTLRALLLGVDPLDGSRLSAESVVAQAEVKVALALGIEALQTAQWVRRWQASKKSTQTSDTSVRAKASQSSPHRTGQGWTSSEDKELWTAVRGGRTLQELCLAHGRTQEGILSRVVRIGLVGSKQEARLLFKARSANAGVGCAERGRA